MSKNKFYFFSLGVAGEGISGSDRIFIELARRWNEKYPVEIFTSDEGRRLCRKQNLRGKKLVINSIKNKLIERYFFINYLYKIIFGIKLGLTIKLPNKDSGDRYLYPASDFWMDFFPALILKLRDPSVKLITTWFQTAPNPLRGYKEGRREGSYRLSAFYYWFMQIPVMPLIKKFSDKVIVNNEDERKRFPHMNKEGKVIVLIGAVPLKESKKWKAKSGKQKVVYDAVFQGRFHPQKGVVELIDIWEKIVDKKPNAKLAMIGDGPLMAAVKSKIKNCGLQDNIKLFGYVFDGPKKYKIFSQSMVVVHPAFYDSGGMASAEAMAFGLPAVGFDLKAYKSYYPEGMIKVKRGDLDAFAGTVLKLLEDDGLRKEFAKEAVSMIEKNWSWEKRAEEILVKVINH